MKPRSGGSPPGSAATPNGAASTTLPPPRLDYDEFRRALAGLTDPDRHPGETEKAAVRDDVHRFCAVLAHLFGDSLDRKTLWGRIGSALATACAKVSDDDTDRWADLCLEHVQADPGQAAACDALGQLRQTWLTRTPEWRHALLNHVRTHAYAVLTHGRARWEKVKAKEVEL